MVDGVVLTMESSIASLRAACKHVGISQSGSRRKLFRRLVNHCEQKQLEVIYAYAAHPVIPVVQPRPQMMATPPARQTERSISVVNFDLSFTGKEVVEGGLPQLVEAQADWEEKLIVLNAFDGKSGSAFALS